ncbi:MAG TPA: hypothetical protein VFM18_18105 [Methanosarcina sp.]|nr:hypothetical protein [Methanosarcina sp.]
MCRYHINTKERCLIDGKTGEILRPSCYDDLVMLCAYEGDKDAQEILRQVFKGEKVITKMVERFQTSHTDTQKDKSSGKKKK